MGAPEDDRLEPPVESSRQRTEAGSSWAA